MKRHIIILLTICICAVSCGSHKTKVFDGYFIKKENGVVLPIAKIPESKAVDYEIEVLFDEHELVLRSTQMLGSCYVSFLYEKAKDGQRDVMDVDLDFQDRINGKYIYAIPYGWLPGKANRIKGVTFFYAPMDVALPIKEEKDSEGTVLFTYPDYTGYKFMFQGDEVEKYLSTLLNKLR